MKIKDKIRNLANKFKANLDKVMTDRVLEMETDDTSHYLIYRVLGISDDEGRVIDIYQNKGRFLYKYAGSFLEKAAILCFQEKFPEAETIRIPNTEGARPKTFEIDCVCNKMGIEIKWRDATTDGDHITKEHTRMKAVKKAGYKPIRVMFYYPNRSQAQKIQKVLEDLYVGTGGEYHYGDAAWEFVEKNTGINLFKILNELSEENSIEDR
jgi:frataxin-like iron-binding protein CyaY